MNRTALSLVIAVGSASPALAHPGAHIHPHGESLLPVLAGLAIIALAAIVAMRMR